MIIVPGREGGQVRRSRDRPRPIDSAGARAAYWRADRVEALSFRLFTSPGDIDHGQPPPVRRCVGRVLWPGRRGRGAGGQAAVRNGLGQAHRGHAPGPRRFREPRRLDRRWLRCPGPAHPIAPAAALGHARGPAGVPRHGPQGGGASPAAQADSPASTLRLRELLGLRQQLGLGARPLHAAGRDRPAARRVPRPGGAGVVGPRELARVVGDAPQALARAARRAQGRGRAGGHRGGRRAQQRGPRAVLRQPLVLPGAAPALEVRAAPGAGHRHVSGPGRRHEHRARQAALPHARRNDPPRQPRP